MRNRKMISRITALCISAVSIITAGSSVIAADETAGIAVSF